MPNWSDDEGRCHYSVNGVPCYQSPVGCPMHGSEKPKPKRKSKVKLSAYERCLNALNMTEPDQRVEVDAEVLARLLKQHEALRAEVERLREALRVALNAMNSMGDELNALDVAGEMPDYDDNCHAFEVVRAALDVDVLVTDTE